MQKIKKPIILHLTSLASGGAGMYTMDFHRSVLACGYESYVAVRGKEIIYPDGSHHKIERTKSFWWNRLKRRVFRAIAQHAKIDMAYAMHNLCERFTCHSAADMLAAMPKKPDIVFVHWVSDFANAKFLHELKQLTGAEIVYVLIDHALYSGGCHYQIDCQGYKDGCHNCPATTSWIIRRGIEKNYVFKKKYLPNGIIIVPTKEDRMRLSQSSIFQDFRFEKLVFPIDADKFCPAEDRIALRKQWNLPTDKKMVFFGATSLNERRKGIKELLEALPLLQSKEVVYVAAGKTQGLALPENTISVGYLNEAQLIQMYQMADVYVCSSLADAGPMMVNQSLMCGTPVVAFPVGVSVELVQTGKTGYLAKYGDSVDLAKDIDAILSLSRKEWKEMSTNCRKLGVDTYANPNEKYTIDALIAKIGK